MRRVKNLLGVFAFSLLVLSLPAVASAQWGGRNGGNSSGGYGNGGYNNSQLKNTIKRLKSDSRDFSRFVDRDLDNSRYNNGRREDSVNQLARDFKNAADRLESRFGNGRDLGNSSREAQDVISLANQLDREMRRLRLSSNVENYWNNVQREVNEIANAYGYRGGGGRGGNNRGNNNGGWRNNFPFPF